MRKTVSFILLALSVTCFCFVIGPLVFIGIWHIGQAAILALGILLFLPVVLWKQLAAFFGKHKLLRRLSIIALSLFLVCFVALNGAMLWAAYFAAPPSGSSADAVILGCAVHGDTPSTLLVKRLDAGLTYLGSEPAAMCVVTGGQGPNENAPEGEVMKAYLSDRGVDPSRIIPENEAENTLQNLTYSAQKLSENNRSDGIVIVTDGFHQLRSHIIASRLGLAPIYHISSADMLDKGVWTLIPGYWFREYFAIAHCLLFE